MHADDKGAAAHLHILLLYWRACRAACVLLRRLRLCWVLKPLNCAVDVIW